MPIQEKIREKLAYNRPGWEAQKIMSPLRHADPYRLLPEEYKKASVVLMMYPERDQVKSIFIERSYHPEDKHSGQISLPGGQLEGKEDFITAARREVYEEIGIQESSFEIIGELSPLYVYVSNYLVQPFVAWTPERPNMERQLSEVADILHIDLEVFTDHRYRKTTDLTIRQSILKDVPYFDAQGRVLWGATAMIMSEFGEVIK